MSNAEHKDWREIGIERIDHLACGCRVTKYTNRPDHWEPCVPCALSHIGGILNGLAARMRADREAARHG